MTVLVLGVENILGTLSLGSDLRAASSLKVTFTMSDNLQGALYYDGLILP